MSHLSDEVIEKYFDFSWRRDPKRFSKFYDLQKFRIREILIISSKYDDFTIEQDSNYADMIYESYAGVFPITPPRVTRVNTLTDAISAVKEQKFDLVITMSRLYGINPFELGKTLKKIDPCLPIVLLLTSITDILIIPDIKEGVDDIFLYRGDSAIFMSIVKSIEDRRNVERDTKIGNARVIIIIEDSIQYYSLFLPMLYREIVNQTNQLIREGINGDHRRLIIRARPKLILVKSFDEAMEWHEKYAEYVLGIISDIAYPMKKGGKKDWNAGFKLVEKIREKNPYMPFCLQSSDIKNQEKAHEVNTTFIFKNAKNLLKSINVYLHRSLGFGDFVFRDKSGKELARAKNLDEFPKVIMDVPINSILYHAKSNHFSNWLFARSEFNMANQLRSLTISDFKSFENLREFLKEYVEGAYKVEHRGLITEFSEDTFEKEIHLSKFGEKGSLGGKGRGIAFMGTVFGLDDINDEYENIDINIPNTTIITTYYFDKFIAEFELEELLDDEKTDEEIQKLIFSKNLPKELKKFIEFFVNKVDYPIAVRSSSLLEDSQYHPLAGIYQSYMLTNNQNREKDRVKAILDTIKLVYASTFSRQSKSFIKTIGQTLEVEKMAIIIQKIVGEKHNERYYPTVSGVARSYNYYSITPAEPEDGVAYLAVGHGEIITSGKKVLTYSPKFPKVLPSHSNPDQSLDSSQREFMALDLQAEFDIERPANLKSYDLGVAREKDKTLKWLGSTFDIQNSYIRDGPHFKGPLVITMPFLLKYDRFPISEIIVKLLRMGKEALGTEVEIEFAINLDYKNETNHEFYLLQIRPMVVDTVPLDEEIEDYMKSSIVYSDKVLGNGIYKNIKNIVYVDPNSFDHLNTLEIQMEVAKYNRELKDEGYLFIAYGRIGTADRHLGIPVKWHEIDNASAFIEADLENFQIDPSSGQHFFLNMISTKKAYFTIPWNDKNAKIDFDWLNKQQVISQKKYVKHIVLEKPLKIMIDGKKSHGVIIETPEIELDNETSDTNNKNTKKKN